MCNYNYKNKITTTNQILNNFYFGLLYVGNFYNIHTNLVLEIVINIPIDLIDKLDITSLYIINSNRYYFKNVFGVLGRPRLFVHLLEQQL